MIHEKPKNEIFASDAKTGEIVEFPNIKRGWGVTENLGFIPPMEYFNAAFNRVDKALAYQLQRGVGEWSADEEYPIGALSVFNGVLYQAKAQNSNKKPSENTSLWGAVINEGWAKTNLLGKTEKAADSDKLDGVDSSGFMQTRNLDAQNLNDFLTPGSFQQGAIGNARLDLNYPVAAYGTLEVFPTGQRYVVYETNETYQRTLISAQNKTWGAWEKVIAPIKKLPFLGANQTRQDLTDQKRANETYTNSTGRAIFVAIQVFIPASPGSTLDASLEIGGVTVASAKHGTTATYLNYTLTALILPNEKYTLRLGGSAKISKWFEIR